MCDGRKSNVADEIAHIRGADGRIDQTREPIVIIVFRLCVPLSSAKIISSWLWT
jgi:hypothetical protein